MGKLTGKKAVTDKSGRNIITHEITEPAEELIRFRKKILLTNYYRLYDEPSQEVPIALKQFREEYDFHVLNLNINLLKSSTTKGVEKLFLEVEIETPIKNDIYIHSIAPTTEWTEKEYGVSGNIGLDFDNIIPSWSPIKAPVEGKIMLKFNWQPEKCSVIAGFDEKVNWTKIAKNHYIDGDNQFAILFMRKRRDQKQNLTLKIIKAEAHHDGGNEPVKLCNKCIDIEYYESEKKKLSN